MTPTVPIISSYARFWRSIATKRSMTFAGDMPEGWMAQLMRGNFDRLASGAAEAAQQARDGLGDVDGGEGVAILVSCIGRKLLMGQQSPRKSRPPAQLWAAAERASASTPMARSPRMRRQVLANCTIRR